ncbi:MAG: nucleotidyltransferase family protein [Patescibacteria group bacterium]
MTKQKLKKQLKEAIIKNPSISKIKKVSLFGSHLHGAARDESDIDLLVEFSTPVGFFELAHIEDSLQQELGNKVDLLTPKALSKYFRDEVLAEAECVYER